MRWPTRRWRCADSRQARRCAQDDKRWVRHPERREESHLGLRGCPFTGERQTDRATRLTLQRSVYGTGVVNEVGASQRIAHEELGGEHIRLEAIARWTGRNNVSLRVCTALGQGMHVIQCGVSVFQGRCTVDAATPTVAKRGKLDGSLLLGGKDAPDATHDAAGRTRQGNAVTVSSGHFTSLEKTTPRTRKEIPVTGCRASWSVSHGSANTCVARRAIASPTASADVGLWQSSASGCVGGGEKVARRRISAKKLRITQEQISKWYRDYSTCRRSPRDRRSCRERDATGSRYTAMMRAACTSSTVRSGICEPSNGSGMSNPSPAMRGITCTW